VATLTVLSTGAGAAELSRRPLEATVEALLDLDVRPVAIGHRGFGETPATGHSRAIEDTVAAVRKGFRAGVSVVEVDVQVTRDGKVAVFHDDVLPDLTCLNRLTFGQLHARIPYVPTLDKVLLEARKFNQAEGPLQGLVIVEVKAAAPRCDPGDTQDPVIVSAVVRTIREMRMTRQVLLTSFSPAVLFLASEAAPEIARILAVSGLQFLSKEQVAAALHRPVTPIHKRLALGLQWAEIGLDFRLPGYGSVTDLLTTAAMTRARVVEADLLLLEAAGMPLVEALRRFGLKVFGFTATTPAEWRFLESLEVDGI
jgi:glycerophosphoryl diester phosphodiesterase